MKSLALSKSLVYLSVLVGLSLENPNLGLVRLACADLGETLVG